MNQAAPKLPAPTTPLADAWHSFEAACIVPVGATKEQAALCRDSFYAGTAALWDLLQAIHGGALSPAAAGAAVRGLGAELQVYVEAVRAREGATR